MRNRGTSRDEEVTVTGSGDGKEKGGSFMDGFFTRLRVKKRVKVLEAREIWGTLHAITSLAVRNVISNIAKIPSEQLAIK